MNQVLKRVIQDVIVEVVHMLAYVKDLFVQLLKCILLIYKVSIYLALIIIQLLYFEQIH